MSEFINVSDLELKSAGATIWWKLRETTTRAKLQQALYDQGIPEQLWQIPTAPTPERCLRRAIKGLREYRRLIRPLKGKKGWALVSEKATDSTLEHGTDVIVKLTDDGEDFTWYVTPDGRDRIGWSNADAMESEVRDSFEEQLHILNHGDVSGWLLKQVHTLNAVTLRDGGGVYFIPPENVAHWANLGEVLKELGKSRAYSMQAIRANDAVEAVFDSLEDEAKDMVTLIQSKVEEGAWGVRAMHTRIDVCEAFMEKVKRYGGFLDTNMDRVLDQIEDLKSDLGAAILAVDEDDEDTLKILGVG